MPCLATSPCSPSPCGPRSARAAASSTPARPPPATTASGRSCAGTARSPATRAASRSMSPGPRRVKPWSASPGTRAAGSRPPVPTTRWSQARVVVESSPSTGPVRHRAALRVDLGHDRVDHPGLRARLAQRGPGAVERQDAGQHLPGEAVEAVAEVGREHDDLDLAASDPAAKPLGPARRTRGASRTRRPRERPGSCGGPRGRHPSLERATEARRRGGREPEVRQPAARSRVRSTRSSPGAPIAKWPRWPVSARSAVSAKQAYARPSGRPMSPPTMRSDGISTIPPSMTVTSGRWVSRAGEVLRGWVASITTAPGCEVVGAEHAVGGGGEEDDEVGIRDGAGVGARERRGVAAHVLGQGLQAGCGAGHEGEAADVAAAGEQAGDGGADAAGGPDDGDVPLGQGREAVEHPAGLGLDGRGGERVAVGHADVGAAAQRDPAGRHGGGQRAEPDGARAQADRPVDGPRAPGRGPPRGPAAGGGRRRGRARCAPPARRRSRRRPW